MPRTALHLETAGIDQAAIELAALMGQTRWITARSMTAAGAAARAGIVNQIYPRIEGGPSRWTRGGLISSKATPENLQLQVGFRLGTGQFTDQLGARGGNGVPAGEYMTTGVAGSGKRKAKSTELDLIKKGVLAPSQRLIPNREKLKTTNGNVSGATLRSITSRIQTSTELQAAKDRRDTKKRRRGKSKAKAYSDYFVMRMNDGQIVNRYGAGNAAFIAKRVGEKKRGIVALLYIVDRASYRRRFPIDDVAMNEFQKQFNVSFEKGVVDELKRRIRKR